MLVKKTGLRGSLARENQHSEYVATTNVRTMMPMGTKTIIKPLPDQAESLYHPDAVP